MSVSKLFKNTMIYGGGALLSKSLLFLINPLLAKYLSETDYGRVSLLLALSGFLILIFPIGQHASLKRFFFDFTSNSERKHVISNIFSSWLIISFIVLLFIIVILYFSSNFFFENILFFPIILLTIIASYLYSHQFFLKGYYLIHEKAKDYALIEILDRTILFIAIFLFITFIAYNVYAWLTGFLLTSMVLFAFTLSRLKRFINFSFDKVFIWRTLQYGLPLLVHAGAGWILSLSDRILINKFLNLNEVAYYSLAYSLCQGLGLASYAINQAWFPRLAMSYVEKKGEKEIYRSYVTTIIGLLSLGAFSLSLIGSEILELFGGTIYASKGYLILLIVVVGYVIEGFYRISIIKFQLTKKTKTVPLITMFAALVHLIFNIILIPKFGINGAAISTVIGFSTLSLLAIYFSKYHAKLPIPWIRVILVMLPGAILFFLIWDQYLIFRILGIGAYGAYILLALKYYQKRK